MIQKMSKSSKICNQTDSKLHINTTLRTIHTANSQFASTFAIQPITQIAFPALISIKNINPRVYMSIAAVSLFLLQLHQQILDLLLRIVRDAFSLLPKHSQRNSLLGTRHLMIVDLRRASPQKFGKGMSIFSIDDHFAERVGVSLPDGCEIVRRVLVRQNEHFLLGELLYLADGLLAVLELADVQQNEVVVLAGVQFGDLFADVEDGDVVDVAVPVLYVVLGPEELDYAWSAEHHEQIYPITEYMPTSANAYFILAILLIAALPASAFKSTRQFLFKNNCGKTIWIGGFGVPLMAKTGWEMPPHSQEVVVVPANTVAIRYWARTGCSFKEGKFVCSTGDCGAPLNNFGVECRGITGQSPATLIELTLSNSGRPDFYDLSNVDGNNLNVRFGPIPGTFIYVDNPDLGKFNCGSPSCSFNQGVCPPELALQKPDGTYCMSICAAIYNADQVKKYPDILGPIANDHMKRDLVCCACGEGTGGCTDPRSHYCCSPLDPRSGIGGRCYVQNWPRPSKFFDRYDRVFKNQCGEAYSWQFDDISSTYQCVDADYEITFC